MASVIFDEWLDKLVLGTAPVWDSAGEDTKFMASLVGIGLGSGSDPAKSTVGTIIAGAPTWFDGTTTYTQNFDVSANRTWTAETRVAQCTTNSVFANVPDDGGPGNDLNPLNILVWHNSLGIKTGLSGVNTLIGWTDIVQVNPNGTTITIDWHDTDGVWNLDAGV